MTNNDLSDAMKKQVEAICKKIANNSKVANITLLFTSPKQPEYKVYLCREIESISIHQDFIQNITDKVIVELKMERDPYIGMLYMRKNMLCQMQVTYTKPDEVLDEKHYATSPDITLSYKAVPIKFEDLFKKFTTEQLFPEKRRENDHDRKTFLMTVELIAEDVYKARKEAMYFTGRDTNMMNMLRYTCNYFGFKYAYLAKPDNKKDYTNFVIPPAYGVEEIMSFLQNAPGLGIYKDGLVSYIMNGLWYVYPRYGEPLGGKYTTEVYCLGGNKFAGLNRMDWDVNEVEVPYTDGSGETYEHGKARKPGCGDPPAGPKRGPKVIHIISPSELKETNWNNIGSENEATCQVAQMMDLLIDHSRRLVDDDTTVLERCIHYPAVVPAEAMDYENFVRIKHIKSYGNLFKLCSEARALQGRTLSFTWEHARPWTFHPASLVTVHYDDHSKMETHEGIVEKVDYTFTKDQTNRVFPRWTCKAEVEVYCSIRDKKLIQSKM